MTKYFVSMADSLPTFEISKISKPLIGLNRSPKKESCVICSGQTLIRSKDGPSQEEEPGTFLEEIQYRTFVTIMGLL